ncbi:HAMP domain-containing sensor histidine kinase [Paenibacillus planticolens]|uniref:Signal transduction histidine-protein kinase ArlS n=1 Tax=Paenibacillus planticolens TaxID=2654976 RepID=A0ABX1ZUY7_9BACL|nr:HAMP domain-containing histidine kinase [Paenibacillus planticolens]NOV03867.1 HAMP domain-containing protein [Paenibacillus planticolens]
MKIKTKASLLSFVWLISILLPLTFAIYVLYARMEKEEEIATLESAANIILENTSPTELLQEGNTRILRKYLPDHTMIRTLDRSSEVINLASHTFEFFVVPPKHTDSPESYSQEVNHETILIVRTPIRQGANILGTLELVSEASELKENLYRLVSIMCVVTLTAMLISISASFLLSKLIFMPLSRMVQTLKEIQTNLQIKKLPLNHKSKDELYQLSETFNHLMERVETSMQKQRQFISDASHEFKTSLTILEGYTSLIRRWGFEEIDLHKEALTAIHEECIRMKHVTYQLLELADLEHEGQLTMSRFDLAALCKESIHLLQPLSSKEIRFISSEHHLIIEADKMKMKQVILIILDNAMKYGKQLIEVYLTKTDSSISIRIKDDGIGIPPEELPFVFERFYRVDRSRNRQTGGSGLGLSIAKRLVNQHQGTIEIHSELEKGTEVIISYPEMISTANPL